MNKQTPTTQDEARQYAIEWQQWVAEQEMSWQESIVCEFAKRTYHVHSGGLTTAVFYVVSTRSRHLFSP